MSPLITRYFMYGLHTQRESPYPNQQSPYPNQQSPYPNQQVPSR
jgi:hypothetical protein